MILSIALSLVISISVCLVMMSYHIKKIDEIMEAIYEDNTNIVRDFVADISEIREKPPEPFVQYPFRDLNEVEKE